MEEDPDISFSSLNIKKKMPKSIETSGWPINISNNKNNFQVQKSDMNVEMVSSKEEGDKNKRRKKYIKTSSKKTDKTFQDKADSVAGNGMMNLFVKLTAKVQSPVKMMINKTKKRRIYKDIGNLNEFHYKLINDNAFFYKHKKKVSNGKKIIQFLPGLICRYFLVNTPMNKYKEYLSKQYSLFKSRIPLFEPNNPLKIIWDTVLTVIITIYIFLLSIEKTFVVELEIFDLERLIAGLLILDFFVSVNTKIFKEGIEIVDRFLIFKGLFKKKIFSEIIPLFVFSSIQFSGLKQYNYIAFVLGLKMLKLKKMLKRIKEVIIHNEFSESLFNLGLLLMKIFFWGHLIACLWHYTGYMSNLNHPSQNNWLKAKSIEGESWGTKYLYSIYWGLTTMLTVGYGDIIPTNNDEMLFNIWAMFVGCGIFGYSMNRIGEILQYADRKNRLLTEQITKASFMMRGKKLPLETQTKVKKYLEFVWKQEQCEDPEHENFIMNKLSSTLRDEIYLNTNVKFLKTVPSFKIFSEKTLISLSRFMKKVRMSPEEPLFKKGDHFGQNELFTGMAADYDVLSLDFSTVFKLNREDVISVLQKNSHEYEKFCQMKDLELLYRDQAHYDVKCESCGYVDHKVSECGFLKYSPNPFSLIGKFNLKKKRFARRFKRRNYIVNSLLEKGEYTRSLNEFLEGYKDDEDLGDLLKYYQSEEFQRSNNINYSYNDFSEITSEKVQLGTPNETPFKNSSSYENLLNNREERERTFSMIRGRGSANDKNDQLYESMPLPKLELKPSYSEPNNIDSSSLIQAQYNQIPINNEWVPLEKTHPTFGEISSFGSMEKIRLKKTTSTRSHPLSKFNDKVPSMEYVRKPEKEFSGKPSVFQPLNNKEVNESSERVSYNNEGDNKYLQPSFKFLQNRPRAKEIKLFFMFDFEKMKSYDNYFPKNNMERVVHKLNNRKNK